MAGMLRYVSIYYLYNAARRGWHPRLQDPEKMRYLTKFNSTAARVFTSAKFWKFFPLGLTAEITDMLS